MPKLSHKLTQYLFALCKVSILILICYVIYKRLFLSEQLSFQAFLEAIFSTNIFTFKTLSILLLFTVLNWFFEIKKWQILVTVVKNINFVEGLKQALSSHATTLFTPMRAGEYGVKALYFRKEKRAKILKLNLLGNIFQMTVTTIFGILGSLYLLKQFYTEWLNYGLAILALLIVLFTVALVFKRTSRLKILWTTEGFSAQLKRRTFALCLMRYLLFSHQFYVLLLLFKIDVDYATAMSMISAMYLLSSLIPVLSLFDVVLKGGIAVMLFGLVEVDEILILVISTLMWLFNTVFPAVLGSVILLFQKSKRYHKPSLNISES